MQKDVSTELAKQIKDMEDHLKEMRSILSMKLDPNVVFQGQWDLPEDVQQALQQLREYDNRYYFKSKQKKEQ